MANTSLLTKIAGTVLVGGGIAGAGTAYALSSNNKVTIKDKLSKENKKLLESQEKTFWDIKLATYNRIKGTDNQFKPATETWGGLKEWCSKNIESEVSEKNEDLYKRVKEVCTVPLHREKLLNSDKKLSDTDDWTTKASSYPGTDNKKIPSIEKNNDTAKELEKWCGQEFDKEYVSDSANNSELVVKWCTKET